MIYFANKKIKDINITVFKQIEKYLFDNNLASDKDDTETIKKRLKVFTELPPDKFAEEAIYVILASGFSQKTAKSKFIEIMNYIKTYGADFDGMFKLFKNVNKVRAIVDVWKNKDKYSSEFYKLHNDDERLKFLFGLPHIGKITCNHLARNLGMNVVKYDVWIQRLGIALYGKNEQAKFPISEKVRGYCDKMFDKLEQETNEPRGYIDMILWKACQIGILKFYK